MPQVKAEGLILRSSNLGEWDRLVVVLAMGYGKVRVVAKGARKIQSRYASVTQPLTHLRFTAYVGGKLPTLSQAEALESFRPLRENLDSLAYALYILELVDMSLVDAQPHDDILSLAIACLHILSHTEHRELLLAFFELRLLARLGFALELGVCPRCAGLPGEHLVVDLPGFPCHKCSQREGPRTQIRVSGTAMNLLSKLSGGDWRAVEGLSAPVAGEREVAAVLDSIVFAKLEKRPESHAFLCAIRVAARE
ncbi:MAG: DNA repair protein RecO [Firmicutes bacterium]|nr:DNA repair protein RecO [candidate division NPL-UPA2 bacterium]